MTTISLKIPEALNRRLKLIARQRGKTRSAIIREAVERLAREEADETDS